MAHRLCRHGRSVRRTGCLLWLRRLTRPARIWGGCIRSARRILRCPVLRCSVCLGIVLLTGDYVLSSVEQKVESGIAHHTAA